MLVLDERHQVHVLVALDDEDALTGVPLGVRVLQDIEQLASLDVKDDFFEPDAAVRPELRVLRIIPGEVLHSLEGSTTCAFGAHIGIGASVPTSVPTQGPRFIVRQPSLHEENPSVLYQRIAISHACGLSDSLDPGGDNVLATHAAEGNPSRRIQKVVAKLSPSRRSHREPGGYQPQERRDETVGDAPGTGGLLACVGT